MSEEQNEELPGADNIEEEAPEVSKTGGLAEKAAAAAGVKIPGVATGGSEQSTEATTLQEQAEDIKTKAQQVQRVAQIVQSAAAGLINPVTGIALLIALALLVGLLNAFSFNQTVGRNDNACLNQEDCSIVKIKAGTDGTCPTGSGMTSWPANAQPGSREAIQATYDLLLGAGFNPSDAYTMTIVAGVESNWNPAADNPTSSALGLWQIMEFHVGTPPILRSSDRLDPVKSSEYAKKLFDGAKAAGKPGVQPWQGHPASELSLPPYVSMEVHAAIERNFRSKQALVANALGASPAGGDRSEGAVPLSSSSCIAGGGATCGPDCDTLLARAQAALRDCPTHHWGYSSYWGQCLGVVARIYQNGGSAGFYCPNERFARYLAAGGTLITSEAQAASVPAGAVILVTTGSSGCGLGNYGHAMISTGGGNVISTYWTGAEGNCLAQVKGWRGAAYGPGTRYLWIPPSKIWG